MELNTDLILREINSAQVLSYEKHYDEPNIKILKKQKWCGISGVFTKALLPQGYPNSVSPDYIAYQKWDTAQAFCSTVMGILATQSVLKGVGVGDIAATPLAATITWILKDMCGHVARILFAYSHGSSLDSFSKRWRLFADVLNDAAMCIEMGLPLFPNYTTIVLCVSNTIKSIVGVAGAATRVAMTQHHAIRGNIGDVSAKDAAQETAVNLVASAASLLIISTFENFLYIFIVMMVLHIVCNYFAVRSVCLKVLNEPRFLLLIDKYLRHDVIATPKEINRIEPITFFDRRSFSLDSKMCGFRIKMGHSLENIVKSATILESLVEIYKYNEYILFPDTNKRIMYVFLKEYASVDNILQAYLHAVVLSVMLRTGTEYRYVLDPGQRELVDLIKRKWVHGPYTSFWHNRSNEVLAIAQNIAVYWPEAKTKLLQKGWDFSKHLLTVDEWRIGCTGNPNNLSSIPLAHCTPKKLQ